MMDSVAYDGNLFPLVKRLPEDGLRPSYLSIRVTRQRAYKLCIER